MYTIEVAEAGGRPDHQRQVGEAVDEGALVTLHAGARPHLGEAAAVGADDAPEHGGVGDVEAGGHHDHVHLTLGAVVGDHTAAGDLVDAVGDQVDVRPGQCRVPVVGAQDALAAHRELRVTLSLSSGSVMALEMLVRHASSTGLRALGAYVRPSAVTSLRPYTAARITFCTPGTCLNAQFSAGRRRARCAARSTARCVGTRHVRGDLGHPRGRAGWRTRRCR